MLKIRLIRMGRRHRPFYRIVVIDSKRKRGSGAYVAVLGTYDPLAQKDNKVNLNRLAYEEWLKKGARPSEAVLKLVLPVEKKRELWPDKQAQSKDGEEGDTNSKAEGE